MAERLGHHFADPSLLEMAICHRSWCAENPIGRPNERLEFLGDAVLGAVVAEELYLRFPEADEGWLSRARATIVRASTLAEAAEEIGLGEEIRLGKGEEATGGREKPSILADGLEALIGAVHLDGGRDASRAAVMAVLGRRIAEASGEPGHLDDKTRLQEHVSQVLADIVTYQVVDSGPEHDKTFEATVHLRGRALGTGIGRTKKQAEQRAARHGYDAVTGADPDPATDGPDTLVTTPHLITPAGPVPAPSSKDEDA
ncbi:MAG: ribonuclease III [Iamia sp.]